jgi:hypothetical protein
MLNRRWTFGAGGVLACAIMASATGAALAAPASKAQAGGFTVVYGGVIDFSPRNRAAMARAASVASPMTTIPLDQHVTLNDGTEIVASAPLSLPWTSDTVSTLVYVEARPGGGHVKPILVGGPSRAERENGFDDSATGSFVLPGTDVPVQNGTYVYQIAGSLDVESAEVVVVPRRGGQPTSGTLDLNLFVLEGSELQTSDINAALNGGFAQAYGQAGVRLGTATLYDVSGADDFLSVDGNDLSSGSAIRQLATLSAQASNPRAANLYFVREISEGTFGISLGLPAALTIPGTISSGVVVNVSAHESDAGFDVSNFAQTMAHETGHSIGLYHTSERDGSLHDVISDTAECPPGEDLDYAACPDGENLMFWSGHGFQVSRGQGFVLLRSPVVR